MAKRQYLLYFAAAGILSFAAVFSLFVFTRPGCYPKKVMKMSSTDMRLASSVNSLWCEALKLTADHPFLAYRLSKEPSISPTSLSRNEVELKLRLKSLEMSYAQYFLLPGTLVTAVMCSTHHGATIYVLSGRDIQNYKKELSTWGSHESDKESRENHYDYWENNDSNEEKHTVAPITVSKILKFQEIPVNDVDEKDCEFSPNNKLFQYNVTSSDTYYVVVHHKGLASRNFVKIRLFLDRTSYKVEKDVRSVHVCGGGLLTSPCDVPLDFLSKNYVLVQIPREPGAGLTTFKVRSSCKPRFSFVTFISLATPFILFILSLLIAVYLKDSVMCSRLNKRHQDRISISASPLLKPNDDEGFVTGEEEANATLTLRTGTAGESTTKEIKVNLLTEFPETVLGHDDQAVKEISDDRPPSYKSLDFSPEISTE